MIRRYIKKHWSIIRHIPEDSLESVFAGIASDLGVTISAVCYAYNIYKKEYFNIK